MKKYIVAFDDYEHKPWLHTFISTGLSDVQDRIINYILDLYDFDDNVPDNFREFKDFCALSEIYIGQIKETDSEFD